MRLLKSNSALTKDLFDSIVVLKKTVLRFLCVLEHYGKSLTSESVEGTSLSLEGIDDIHSGDSLPLGVFGVGDGITDDVLKEDLEDTTGLLIDQARDTLDTTTTRQTADSGLGDTLDVITQDFAMTLSASLSESFASFTTSSHVEFSDDTDEECFACAGFIVYLVDSP